MDMMAIRRSIMQGRQLPPGYQRVAYLEGTGTQYIDSGIECTIYLGVEYEYEVSTNVNASLCGGISLSGQIFRHHGTPYSFASDNTYFYMLQNVSTVIPTNIPAPQINTRYKIFVDPAAGKYAYSGANVNLSGTFTPLSTASGGKSTTGKNYGIMGRISNSGDIQSRPHKMYYFRLYRGGKLIGDFVPCYRKTDSVAGMYDLVTNSFFTNAGSGTFGVGPDV